MNKLFVFLYFRFVYSLENIVLNLGNKDGVYYCPDQIIIGNEDKEPFGIKINSSNVKNICIKYQRGCYIKHCSRFCLYRPNDKYYSDYDCPAFTDGIDLWYVPNSFTADSLYNL